MAAAISPNLATLTVLAGAVHVIKLYKSIFRVDFPVCFGVIDRLGKYSDFLHRATRTAPFTEAKSEVNLTTNTVANWGRVAGHQYRISLTVSSLDAVAEYPDGIELGELAKHPVFALGDEMSAEIKGDIGTVFERVGLRMWILVDDPAFRFEAVRDDMRASLPQIDGAIRKEFPKPKDIGLIFEATNEHEVDVRVQCGPYRSSEFARYFKKDPAVAEGLILDIDISERSVDIPKFRLSRFASRSEAQVASIVTGIASSLKARHQ